VPNVVLNSVGVVDMDATSLVLSRLDLLERLSNGGNIVDKPNNFGIRPGGYNNQWDFATIIRSHPTCFPYGTGSPGPSIGLKRYFRWAMRYHDGRFAKDKYFYFDLFNTQQKREIWERARVTFCRSDWDHVRRGIQAISKSNIDIALAEER
jgi:hypothetical protein